MRANGAITGGAAGFQTGDSVFVMKKHDNSVVKVIGHTDGVHACSHEYLIVSLLENAHPHTGKGLYCIIWDLKNDCMATDVTLNTSTPEVPLYASFPCLISDISIWTGSLSSPTVNGSIFINGQTGRTSPPDTDPAYYYDITNGSGAGEQPSWPTLLGTTDTSSWLRVVSGSREWWDGLTRRWDWVQDEVFNSIVNGCYGYSPWYSGDLGASLSRGLAISPYFTDYAGVTSFYQWYSSLQVNSYHSSSGYQGYYPWEISIFTEDTSSSVASYLAKTPYGTLCSGTLLNSSSTVTTTTPGGVGEYPTSETITVSSTQAWAAMPAFGRSDKYTKNNIIHIANISTSRNESAIPSNPGGTITITHYVEAFTHSCDDSSAVNPLTISSNTSLKNAIATLLDQETTAQGLPLSGVKLYMVSGEIKKTG